MINYNITEFLLMIAMFFLLKPMFISYHPHHKKKVTWAVGKTFFYLIQTKYYFLFQILPSS